MLKNAREQVKSTLAEQPTGLSKEMLQPPTPATPYMNYYHKPSRPRDIPVNISLALDAAATNESANSTAASMRVENRSTRPALDDSTRQCSDKRSGRPNERVPPCTVTREGIPGSVVHPVLDREEWERLTSELLIVAKTAAHRRANVSGALHGLRRDHAAEAELMSMKYIQERIDTDDPMHGFTIHTNDARCCLQGFICYTTFTTWTYFFKFDSGCFHFAGRHHDQGIRCDLDNSLAIELEEQKRAGDPAAEGVIWSTVGEISLLGGLGCGGFLVQLVLEEMLLGGYRYAVVQATKSSAAFFSRLGFVQVGALATYKGWPTPIGYRHWASSDDDVTSLDESIMMAIRLTPDKIPQRVLFDKGGIAANFGSKITMCSDISHVLPPARGTRGLEGRIESAQRQGGVSSREDEAGIQVRTG